MYDVCCGPPHIKSNALCKWHMNICVCVCARMYTPECICRPKRRMEREDIEKRKKKKLHSMNCLLQSINLSTYLHGNALSLHFVRLSWEGIIILYFADLQFVSMAPIHFEARTSNAVKQQLFYHLS